MSKGNGRWQSWYQLRASSPTGRDVYPTAATRTTAANHGGCRLPSDRKDGRPDQPGEILRVKIQR